MSKLKLSVVTPSFEQGRFIQRTIDSVLKQDYDNFEYIVFDAGSTDSTHDILHSYGAQISWVSEPDNGQAHAVNKGIRKATGDIICWLNSDDTYADGALTKVAEFFEENQDVSLVYGLANHIDIHDKVINQYQTSPFDPEHLLENCFICQPALFFRKDIVQKIGYLDEDLYFCMDYEFWLRASSEGLSFKYVEEHFANSRLYNENKTLNDRHAVHREVVQMFKNKLGYVPSRWIINYGHTFAEKKSDRTSEYWSFVAMLFLSTISYSLYYNKTFDKEITKQLKRWLLGAFKKVLK